MIAASLPTATDTQPSVRADRRDRGSLAWWSVVEGAARGGGTVEEVAPGAAAVEGEPAASPGAGAGVACARMGWGLGPAAHPAATSNATHAIRCIAPLM